MINEPSRGVGVQTNDCKRDILINIFVEIYEHFINFEKILCTADISKKKFSTFYIFFTISASELNIQC